MNEILLVQKAAQGDKKAFCDLYDNYKDRLFRYAFYRLRSQTDAEDAVSECVVSAWKQIANLRDPGAFQAWIFRILSACCNRLIKEQIARKEMVPLDSLAGNQTSNHSNEEDTRMFLEEALKTITEDERDIVLLSVVAGLKSNEIAEITGLTAGSVRSNLSRSLKKMREFLEQ